MPPIQYIAFGVSATSLTIGLVGFILARYEHSRRRKLEEKVRSQQWATLDRARYVIGDHELFKEFDAQLTHPMKHRLWNIHQAASDLYIALIEQYLSGVKRFTYVDLKRLAMNGAIYWRWQEQQWRLAICQRPENRDVDPPDYFVTSPRNSAFRDSDEDSSKT